MLQIFSVANSSAGQQATAYLRVIDVIDLSTVLMHQMNLVVVREKFWPEKFINNIYLFSLKKPTFVIFYAYRNKLLLSNLTDRRDFILSVLGRDCDYKCTECGQCIK